MKLKDRTIRLSRFTQIVILFVSLGFLSHFAQREFRNSDPRQYVMGSDMEGYYQYLPYFFLHNWDDFNHLPWAKPYGEDKTLNVYTCGVAIMQAPFFLAAHATTLFFHLEDQDGYSNVYFIFVFIAGLFYATLGLVFIYKALLRYYSEKIALITASLIFFATNLYYYTIFSPGMSHVYSFALIAVYLYFVPIFYERPNFRNTIWMIVPLAMATLIRPTNLIAGFFFILYGIASFKELKARFLFLFNKWYLLLLMLVAGLVVFIPQMAYWYKVTGSIFTYSYQSEGFPYILNPQISTVLIGARNGWYIYTPLMFFASMALLYMVNRKKSTGWAILIPMVLIIYIDASWWAPTFSAAAGYRALIEFLPLMAIPTAWIIKKSVFAESKVLKSVAIFLLLFMVFYNIQFAFKFDSWLWWDTEWQWKNLLRIFRF